MSATEVLSALDRIHGTVSVIGSMNADYTVTAQRLRRWYGLPCLAYAWKARSKQ